MTPPRDPVPLFEAAAARSDRFFWLDGGGARDWSGSRSIIGVLEPHDVSLSYTAADRRVLRHRDGAAEIVGDDVFAALASELSRDAGDPAVHWVGYFGYAARPDLAARPAGDVPDAVWMRVRSPAFVVHQVSPQGAPGSRPRAVADPPAWYADAFARVQEHLHAGDSYEVNLTYRDRLDSAVDPVSAYLRLREANPAPYAGYLRHGDVHLLSSSPERYATLDRDRSLVARPIKGTTPRDVDPDRDEALRAHLASDPKLRAENLMITDLLRNDLSLVCRPGTVEVPDLMRVESYPSVHQLVTTVRGRLREEVSTIDALRALFPAGSMTGAPKRRTMEIIDAVESGPRGVYSGAFGWICADGRADLGVVIRSLVATPGEGGWQYRLGTGGGITVRSDLAEEWAETRWKAERLSSVLDEPVPGAD